MDTLQTILFVPFIAAMVARLVSKQPQLSAAVGALTMGGLWFWLRGLEPSGIVVIFWGQPMALTTANQSILLLLLAGLSLLFGLSILFPSGDWFNVGGLVGFAFLAASVLVRPFPIAMGLILLAAGSLALTIQSGQAGSVRGSFRYIVAVLLAVPLLLIVGWQVEVQSIDWLLQPGQLTALATLLLLAGFPFHIWLQAVVNEADPLPLVLVAGLAPLIPLLLLFQQLTIHPNLLDATFQQLIWLSGSLTLLVAGVLAVSAIHLKRLIGSVLLLDMALTILCLTLPEQVRWETAVSLQIGRFGSLMLVAGGWLLLKRHQADWPLDRLPDGLGRRAPLQLALFGVGLFSLLGLPFTLGFAGHWQLLTAVGELANRGAVPWWLPAIALLSLGLGAVGVLRALAAQLKDEGDGAKETAVAEPRWLQFIIGAVLLAAFWLAFFPQTILTLSSGL